MLKNFRTPVLAASLILASSGAMADHIIELTTNGSFDESGGSFDGWTQFENGGTQSIVTGNTTDGAYAANLTQTIANNSLIKNANIGIGQVSAGQEITISFDARGTTANGGVVFAEFFSELDGGGVSAAEILGGGPLALNADPDVWTSFLFTTFAGPDVSGGVTLQLGAVCGAAAGCLSDVFFDNVSVSIAAPIPVPAAVWLLGSALGLLGLRRRNA